MQTKFHFNIKRIGTVMAVMVMMLLAVAALPAQAEEAGDIRIEVGADAVFYRQADGGIEIWVPDADSVWYPAIVLSADEVSALEATDETRLIASAGNLAVYLSAEDEFHVANGADAEGKVRVVVFDTDFFYLHQYEYNVYGA